jgi:uncharacterized repeat protein (TIGR01451 family)
MWHLPHVSLRLASAVAVLVLVPAWKSGSILNSPMQAQGPAAVAAANTPNPLGSRSDPAAAARLSSSYGKLPISFEVNQGQTDGSVQFLARGAGYTLFLTPGEAVLSLHAPHTNTAKPGSLTAPSTLRPTPAQPRATLPPSTVRLQLIGANTAAKAEGIDPLPGKSNYFFGNDPAKWHTDVPTYAKVRYSSVYPSIDLLYYGNQEGRLEHDFILAPGADPNSIAISLRDSDGVVPDQNGGLILHTRTGNVTLRSPTVYQDIDGQRKTISATYLLANNQIKFQLGNYDRNASLVIDPVIQYSAVFGGSGEDTASAIAVDGSGNAYVAGYTESPDFPVVRPYQGTYTGTTYECYSAFVSKINAVGTALLYSTFLGGSCTTVLGIAVDIAGRAYVTGFTWGGLPVKNAYQPTPGGNGDAFLTVFGPEGNTLIYSTYLGGKGNEFGSGDGGTAIALDASGNAYITGFSALGFPTLHSVQPQGPVFVAKFNAAGVLQYSSVLGSDDFMFEGSNAIAVDAPGSAYIIGSAGPGLPVTKNAFQSTCPRSYRLDVGMCAFVTKLTPSGDSLAYSTYLGSGVFCEGCTDSEGSAIAVDSSGNAYVAGEERLAGFPVTNNAFQKTYGGNGDGFIAKLNASGTGLLASTYLGGKGRDYITSLALDQYRQVYLSGVTCSSDFPLKAPMHTYSSTPCHGFVTTLSASLSSIVYYSTHFGSFGPAALAVDKALNVYVTGSTTGDIKPTSGALSTGTVRNPGGGEDIFVSKLVIMDDLALGLSASSGSVVHGGNLTYTIAVTSKGPDFGYNVRIDDPLPSGTTFVSYNPGGGTCTTPPVGATGTLHCVLNQLEKGDTYSVKLTVKVNAVAGTTLSNTATTVSNMQDFVQSNNKGTLTTKVN